MVMWHYMQGSGFLRYGNVRVVSLACLHAHTVCYKHIRAEIATSPWQTASLSAVSTNHPDTEVL
jgi:hypothetical protein